jgi:transposase
MRYPSHRPKTRLQDLAKPQSWSEPLPPDRRIAIGIDVAKDTHWVTAMTDVGDIVFDQRVANTPPALDTLCIQLAALGGMRTIGIDMLGGIATLLTTVLLAADETVVHVPGKAVNRARTGFRSGDNKSDPQDARTIADQVRTRRADLRVLTPDDERLIALKALVTRRRTLIVEQTRRLAHLHELLQQVHPGLDQRLDVRGRIGGLYLLTRFVTPQEIRTAGVDQLVAFLETCPHRLPTRRTLARLAVEAATEQQYALPGEAITAQLVRDLAADALAARTRLDTLHDTIAEELARHPEGALIQSLPGMGVVTAAEFLAHAGSMTRYASAHHLAAYAGLAPVIRQTGRTLFLSRPLGGNKELKRACYQATQVASHYHPASRTYYHRKRAEGKSHLQATIALARRRVIVLYAMLRDQRPYTEPTPSPSPGGPIDIGIAA